FTPAQFRQRPALGFRWRRTAGKQFFVEVFQVLREFLDDGGFACRRKLQALKPPSDLCFPVSHVDSPSAARANHSQRSAISGSTFVARRTGSQQANNAVVSKINTAMTTVSGSAAVRPKSKLVTTRVAASAALRPITTPVITSHSVSRNISRITS